MLLLAFWPLCFVFSRYESYENGRSRPPQRLTMNPWPIDPPNYSLVPSKMLLQFDKSDPNADSLVFAINFDTSVRCHRRGLVRATAVPMRLRFLQAYTRSAQDPAAEWWPRTLSSHNSMHRRDYERCLDRRLDEAFYNASLHFVACISAIYRHCCVRPHRWERGKRIGEALPGSSWWS